ncbi:unnamed protein product [Paramecium sonneborni]|uniref:C2 NT-type domain-containing protein n=1 Tax=Paramecium sonneborni TaxID=65129 RepID=A0A8S1MD57_9CILI|nr:unnamed protein product [Paramecium sonneborni]
MNQILTYTIIFKKLSLTLNTDIAFNVETKSLDKNSSLLNYMKINHQYEQYMEVKCIVKKLNLKYEEKIRKLYIILSDGKTKKIAGFALFDISVALNLNMRQKEYSINLIQCPDIKAFTFYTIIMIKMNSINHNKKSITSRALRQNEREEFRKLKLENVQLENELKKVKQDIQIVETQYKFLGSQYKQLQVQQEEKIYENNDLQNQVQQLCTLNSVCIEKIKQYEKLHSNQAQQIQK